MAETSTNGLLNVQEAIQAVPAPRVGAQSEVILIHPVRAVDVEHAEQAATPRASL
jgi:hypothetical protein